MKIVGFKQFIIEAFSIESMAKVTKLMTSFLSKKLGGIFRWPEPDIFKKADGRVGYGIRYYLENGKAFRLNWIKGIKSQEVVSIDIWDGTSKQPSHEIDVEGISVAKYLPLIPKLILNPIEGEHNLLESKDFSNSTSTFLTEGKKDDAMALLKKGKTRKDLRSMGFSGGIVYQATKALGLVGTVTVNKGTKEQVKPDLDIVKVKSILEDDSKIFDQKMEDLEEIAKGIAKKAINSLLVTGKAGTGKTFTIEKVLAGKGLKEGEDWLLVKAGVSPFGAYQSLYRWKNKIIVFDDADGIFRDEQGRNLMKAALDDKDVRKITWVKASSLVYRPEEVRDDPEKKQELEEKGLVPNSFNYEGSVIFITNMDEAKADPDGAIRSRSLVININPSKEAMMDRMRLLLPKLGPKGTSMKDKKDVMKFIEEADSDEVTLRKFVKSLKVKQMGMKNWQRIVKNYA